MLVHFNVFVCHMVWKWNNICLELSSFSSNRKIGIAFWAAQQIIIFISISQYTETIN